ncbi:hypothetical protein V8F20_011307 [Naviculisporaceae sp. PSN 640]
MAPFAYLSHYLTDRLPDPDMDWMPIVDPTLDEETSLINKPRPSPHRNPSRRPTYGILKPPRCPPNPFKRNMHVCLAGATSIITGEEVPRGQFSLVRKKKKEKATWDPSGLNDDTPMTGIDAGTDHEARLLEEFERNLEAQLELAKVNNDRNKAESPIASKLVRYLHPCVAGKPRKVRKTKELPSSQKPVENKPVEKKTTREPKTQKSCRVTKPQGCRRRRRPRPPA